MTTRPIAQQPAMADYGVGDDWEPLPWTWVAQRLASARNVWLVTVSGDGRPHSMPVWGVWDDASLRFMFSCAPTARKVRNLAANPRVVITGPDTVEAWSMEGTARLLDPAAPDTARWWQRWVDKYTAMGEDGLSADIVEAAATYEVTPERLFAVIERPDDFARRATRFNFPA